MPALVTPIELVIVNTDARVDVYVTDANNDPIDATVLEVRIMDLDGTVLLSDSYLPGPPTRIVKPAGTTGYYYVLWGDPAAAVNIPTQTETNTARDLLVMWTVTAAATTEQIFKTGLLRMVTARTAAIIPGFRLLIDKSAKMVSDTPTEPCYTGYTDSMLVEFLWQGLSSINAYQPYPMWDSLDDFPGIHLEMLYESALLCGVMSQQLFAIDTDIESWNSSGNSFVINHQPKLAAFFQQIQQRLDNLIPSMKRHYVDIGTVRTQLNGSYRLNTVISAMAPGVTFRGLTFGS